MTQPKERQDFELPEELEIFIQRLSCSKDNSKMFLQPDNNLGKEIQKRWKIIEKDYPN